MLGDMKHHHFMDISQIGHKDIEIQFSVEHVLENDDYLMMSKPKEKGNKNKNCQKKNRVTSKKPIEIQMKSTHQDRDLNKRKITRDKLKLKEHFEEKDTQDDSQTVKITKNYLPSKFNSGVKQTKIEANSKDIKVKGCSNKVQPDQKERSRTKSLCSIQSDRRRSQIKMGPTYGIPSKSNISIEHSNSHSQLKKNRSQTKRDNFDDMKVKNENIVRNDYFQENQREKRFNNQRNSNNEKLNKKKSVSNCKKGELFCKKTKKEHLNSKGQLKNLRSVRK